MKSRPAFGKQEGYPLPKLIILRGISGSGKTTVEKDFSDVLSEKPIPADASLQDIFSAIYLAVHRELLE